MTHRHIAIAAIVAMRIANVAYGVLIAVRERDGKDRADMRTDRILAAFSWTAFASVPVLAVLAW